jgi:Tfp pilus assembly protein PilN
MSEFNLIPEEYFAGIRKRRLMLLAISAGIAVVTLMGGSIGAAHYVLAEREHELQLLRQQKALSVQQQAQLTQLQQDRNRLQSDLRLLSSLQSGAPVTRVIAAVEKAAQPSGVSFESWAFMRSGIRAGEDTEAKPPSYYALSMAEQGFPADWESLAQMAIEGRAKDHAALSSFVQRLFEQPDIEDVRIQRSTRNLGGVEFNLAIVIATAGPTGDSA